MKKYAIKKNLEEKVKKMIKELRKVVTFEEVVFREGDKEAQNPLRVIVLQQSYKTPGKIEASYKTYPLK